MLSKVADFYEDKLGAMVKALTSMLEPAMIVVVGESWAPSCWRCTSRCPPSLIRSSEAGGNRLTRQPTAAPAGLEVKTASHPVHIQQFTS